jgi:methylglutaconyl-CoA hydratase
MDVKYKFVTVEDSNDGTRCLVLNRPEKRNAFHSEMLDEMLHVLHLSPDNQKILKIRGNGPVFCGGGDIEWMHAICHSSDEIRLKEAHRIRQLFHSIHTYPIPTIAFVQGGAYGGGVGLAAACDFVVGDENALFSTSEVRLGIVPACLAPYLVRRVGFSTARQLFLTGERLRSSDACSLGLVDIVESAGTTSNLDELLSKLSIGSPNAQRDVKSLLLSLEHFGNVDSSTIKFLANSWGSLDGREGTIAFLQKRMPKWEPYKR